MAPVEQNERRIWAVKSQGVGLKLSESIWVFYISGMPMYNEPFEQKLIINSFIETYWRYLLQIRYRVFLFLRILLG